jgi:putative molybdopterin biosynthesis protein
MNNDKFYSIEELAKILKVSYLTVYRWVKLGKLKTNKAGKQYRIKKEEIESFIENK